MAPTTSIAAGLVAVAATLGGWFTLQPHGNSVPVAQGSIQNEEATFSSQPEATTPEDASEALGTTSWAAIDASTSLGLLSLIFASPLALVVDALALLFGFWCVRRRSNLPTPAEGAEETEEVEAAEPAGASLHAATAEAASAMATQAATLAATEAQVEELRAQLARVKTDAEAREEELKVKVQELEAACQKKTAKAVRDNASANTAALESRVAALSASLADAEEQKRSAVAQKQVLESQLHEIQVLVASRGSGSDEQLRAAILRAEQAEAALRDGSAARRAREAEASAAAAQFECDALRAELARLRVVNGGDVLLAPSPSKDDKEKEEEKKDQDAEKEGEKLEVKKSSSSLFGESASEASKEKPAAGGA
eukprot:TRINITY_DN16947_c0_g1_i1.p1 TRINITY_DN16947_c0_g1~~TRINITY_DN16947_c0_g1_i1.p1  ORF type:complete len:369 (-),score=119.52 TRINITY_DN16947_c0_g1_i1:170-1276(-)